MSTSSVKWDPTSPEEKNLKNALLQLSSATDSVLLSPMDKSRNAQQEKKFLLQGQSYFALKAYVMTGKMFPVNDAAFDQEIAKNSFKRLNQVDPDIYQQTKDALTMIGSTCKPYYDNELFKMVHAGSVAVTWSATTLKWLKEMPAINLYSHLMVIMDLKYKKMEDRDEVFRTALSAAHASLLVLQKEAESGRNECRDIVTGLLKFREDTRPLLPKVVHLIKQYDKGPAQNHQNQTTPYLKYLQADYTASTAKFNQKLADYNSKYDDWKTATGLAIGVGVSFGWFPIFGWIPLAFLAHNADGLHDAWATLDKEVQQLKSDNAEEFTLINWVQKLVKQCAGLEEKINAAVDAVQVLCTMFEQQANSYEQIKKSLDFIDTFSTSEDAGTRKAFISAMIDDTVGNLTQLQTAAAGFVQAIITEQNIG